MKILAGSNQEKVLALAQLTEDLLDELGYTDYHPKLSAAHLTIELKARHRSSGHRLHCYGCTLAHEIPLRDLQGAHKRYALARRRDKDLVGIFFSLSGFHLTARTWFSRLDAPDRSDYHLLGVDKICALLRRAKLIASSDQIIHAIESRILARLEAGHLVFATGRFYWIFRIETKRGAAYAVLDAYGSPVSPRVGISFKRLDGSLKGKRLLNLQAMEKVLLALAESGQKNIEFLSRETKEPLDELREVLQELLDEGFLIAEPAGQPRWRCNRYSVKPEFDIFLRLARLFLDSAQRFKFLRSNFAVQMLVAGLRPYLEERFHLKLSEEERSWLPRFLAVSPSALSYALFAPADEFISTSEELEHSHLPGPEKERLRTQHLSTLYANLLLRYATDAQDSRFDEMLRHKGVRGHLYRITAKAASADELFFSMKGESYLTLAVPSVAGVADQKALGHQAAVNGEMLLSNAKALMHIQEFDYAIELFDRALKELKDPGKLLEAWYCKGSCLSNQKRYAAAITCLNEALRYDSNYKEAWLHKATCLRGLGDNSGAVHCARRAIEIDPAYDEARDFLRST
ncbi:Tetratricopeptide repeat protein [Candidatus Methylomirabilis lanthanidiphila]|uniref:Tetratricopeptide repeat protein n=1 Tax=Candidatus Methylomirabilis lanthanidiphila TaxID=2211376 RepID=A0A564ZJK0_9BACT|nr:Tetratricopeptide repeat protein [Candidatus Methylomirabilis lanthanidiphila]